MKYHYEFNVIEKFGGWFICYDKFHKVYSVSLGYYWLDRHFKTKKTAKQFIKKHKRFSIDDLKSNNLS